MKWFWIIMAIAYLLSPYDLIPGASMIGWLDDIFVLVLLYRYLSKLNRPAGSGEPPFHQRQQDHGSGEAQTDTDLRRPRSPYDILEVPPSATQEEIKAAYRKLVNQYHPDKVSHLGDEFQDLADKRFKEIQEAYHKLVR